MKLIERNHQRIIDLCRKHKVKSLAVFGSILTDRFNDKSDVDLLVDFEDWQWDLLLPRQTSGKLEVKSQNS